MREARIVKDAGMAAADFLYLAAAPTFAIMALLTGLHSGGSSDALCSAAGASPLSGMVPMYVLMSAFHLAPWLKLIAGWRNSACRSDPERGLPPTIREQHE